MVTPSVLKHFLDTDIGEIRIFFRDEKKLDDMRHELQVNARVAAGLMRFGSFWIISIDSPNIICYNYIAYLGTSNHFGQQSLYEKIERIVRRW